MPEDHFTNTPADAGAYEHRRGMSEYLGPDHLPSRSDLAEDEREIRAEQQRASGR